VSKPHKPAPKLYPHEWVTLEIAVDQIEAAVRSLSYAEQDINEGLQIGWLKSGEWQISPDGEGTWRPLNSSDWAQRRVWVFIPLVFKARRVVCIDGPKFAGQVLICRADLDRYYPSAARPTMTAVPQSDELSPPTTPAPEKQKPGIKPFKDWPNRFLAPEMVRVAYKTPDLLRDRPELVRHVRKFLHDQIGWEPFDNKPINRELDRLLSRIE
jgi:hypothetical protein